ncbi:5-(carboxyamino)imidazole ribonucleotide synthase [Teredinibacter waterburyi]|uniref:5-(carboxyamino)imidazole ribonucleotide synthase n=1 Tax=Teredinibacter waterburyi TaxID=1500538 RepID=UPI00165F2A1E|nr:5-(carboxyamino)imidazole ribonucleotide synthase [Teredinibacter waterburyi]
MKVAVIGTGQLSLLLAQASNYMGIELIPFGTKKCLHLTEYCNPVYARQAENNTLSTLAESVDVITYESENISIDSLKTLNCTDKIYPSIEALEIFQDRLTEKRYLNDQHLATVKYQRALTEEDLNDAVEYLGFPAVIKSLKNGYDGRGQKVVHNMDELQSAWLELEQYCIIEEYLAFDYEISIIAARDLQHNIVFYPVSENYHRHGQLRLSLVSLNHPMQKKAEDIIKKVLHDLNYIGCMTVELFVKGDKIIVNEVAPRVHNSGHWTIDGTSSSQFVSHLTAITGKSLSQPDVIAPAAMVNLIGHVPNLSRYEDDKSIKVYDYQKEPRSERKVGHINLLGNEIGETTFYYKLGNLLKQLNETTLSNHIYKRLDALTQEKIAQ